MAIHLPLLLDPDSNSTLLSELSSPFSMPLLTADGDIPDTGYVNIYAKDGSLYMRDSTGLITAFGGNEVPVIPLPPPGSDNTTRFFNGFLGSTGLNSGTTNQNVNGSTTPQKFYVESSDPDFDIHIMEVVILITDSSVRMNRFGFINGLTNGWNLTDTESGDTTYVIKDAKTFGGIIRQINILKHPIGDLANVNIITNSDGNNDSHIAQINMSDYMPYGLRLGRGGTDRLESIVSDDLTGLAEFYVRVTGFKNYGQAV